MAMTVRPKVVTRSVKLLTNPSPRFVSMVGHGANQTPWKSVKNADGTAGVEISDSSKKENSMPDAVAAPAIRNFTFKKAYFADAASVQKWLDDAGFDGFTITEKGSAFGVEGSDTTDDMFSELKLVRMAEGVSANVGPLKEDAAKAADTSHSTAATLNDGETEDGKPVENRDGATKAVPAVPAPTTTAKRATASNVRPLPAAATKALATRKAATEAFVAETTKKWSYWEVYSSDEVDLNGIIAEAANDGVPPGMSELFDALRQSVGNTLKSEQLDSAQKRAGLDLIGNQFASIVHAMYEVFSGIGDSDESVQASIKSEKTQTRKWMGDMANFIASGGELTKKLNTWGDQEGTIKPKTPESGEGNNPTADNGALVGDTDADKIEVPDNGRAATDTTAEGNTGTDTAAVKGTEEPADVLAARKLVAEHDAKAAKKPKTTPATMPAMPAAKDALTLGNLKDMIGEAVTTAMTPVVKEVAELKEQVTVAKAEADTFLKRAPTKKSASTAGAEETVADSETAKKAAIEEEATQKFEAQLRRNQLGIV